MPFLNILLFSGLWCGGLRNPYLWSCAAGLLWAWALWRPPAPKLVPGGPLWAAWLGWMLLSALSSNEPLRALAAFSRPLTAALFFAMLRSHWKRADRPAWFWLLAFSAAGLGLAALLIPVRGMPWVGLLYPYYNYTACVEAMAFGACLGFLGTDAPTRRQKAVVAAIMTFLLAMILASRSRGALAACAAAAALWSARRWGWRPLAGFFLASLLVLPFTYRLWSPLLKTDKPGAYVRPAIWRAAIAVANDHPLLGVGPGLFERGFLLHNFPVFDARIPSRYGMLATHAHSEFLQSAAETGWPGMLLFLAAILSCGMAVWKGKGRDGIAEAGSCTFAAALAQSLVDNVFHLPGIQWLAFSSLAAGLGDPPSETRRTPAWLRPLCAAGLALAATSWIPDWTIQRYEALAFRSTGDEAAAWMGRALKIAPGDPGLWEDLARIHLRRSPPETDSALAALREAARRDPKNAIYPLMQAETLAGHGRWTQALPLADDALALEPDFLEARLLKAQGRCIRGRRAEAASELAAVDSTRNRQAAAGLLNSGVMAHFDASKHKAVSDMVRMGCRPRLTQPHDKE